MPELQRISNDPMQAPAASVAHPPPTRRSVWTPREKLIRLLWATLGGAVWQASSRARPWLIRRFGGQAGAGCTIARSVHITIPWNIRLGNRVRIGERVVLYSLGPITIDDDVVIDFKAHLCAGSHDMRDSTFPLTRPPITVGAGSFIGIDAFLGPGVTVGRACTIEPRACVYRSTGDGEVLRGNPAIPIAAPPGPKPSGTPA